MIIDQSRTPCGRGEKAPTIQELLADPTTQLLMERDRVRRDELLDLLAAVQARLGLNEPVG